MQNIFQVRIRKISHFQSWLHNWPVTAKLVTGRESTINADTTIDIKVLIDCGAEGDFIDQTYATIMGIKQP